MRPPIEPHTGAGAKHDAGKLPAHSVLVYFPRAIEQVAAVIAHGEKLHGYNTWHTIPEPIRRYNEADIRHAIELCKGNTHDTGANGSHLHHLAHRAWNALALLELEMRKEETHGRTG